MKPSVKIVFRKRNSIFLVQTKTMTLFDLRFKTNIIMALVYPLNQIDIIFNYNVINKHFPIRLK